MKKNGLFVLCHGDDGLNEFAEWTKKKCENKLSINCHRSTFDAEFGEKSFFFSWNEKK